MEYKHNFAWGDTRGIRAIMMKYINETNILQNIPWENFGYPEHEGDPELIRYTKTLINELTGHQYKHILITNGATHALNAYVAAIKTPDTDFMYTHKLYFLFYPGIASNHGLTHATQESMLTIPEKQIGIMDSPSNPEGKMHGNPFFPNSTYSKNIIFDAAYYTPTYCGIGNKNNLKCINIIPNHDAIAGSFNKLTGINGLRVGWLATDDDNIYNNALEYIEHDICGVSYPSQHMALEIMKHVNLNHFYWESKLMLDSNKGEMSRLNHIFGNQPIPTHGMFALFEIDAKLKRLLEKASVKFMPGNSCGDFRDSARFNLSNSNEATKNMVDAILKADKKR
jgi:aspartate/methionine/tyrosine aminotransferase